MMSWRAMDRHKVITPMAIALTFASGAMDVASFTRLGGVFTSVMTGNIVLCGLAAARGSVSLILHTATTFAGYVAGVAAGTRIGWWHARVRTAADAEQAWAPHVRTVLLGELALLAGLLTGWEVTGGRPTGLAQYCLLATAAAAMGMQAAAVGQMGLTEVSTTYLTGTLTGLVRSLASPERKRESLIRPGVLVGLAAGALLCGLFVATVPAGAPVLPAAALIVVLLLGRAAS
jgi:uncharacterized membrane protein YoaK (UPF0700 family)